MTNRILGEISNVVRKTAGDTIYFFGTIASDKLRTVTYVPVLDASPKTFLTEVVADGYQRRGTPARMRAFGNFLYENQDSVVPPILLSGRDGWTFVPEASGWVGTLSILKPAAIVDGQHRVGGFVWLHEHKQIVKEVAFILLYQLTREIEMKTFITVNNMARGVAKSTTAYLEAEDEAQIAWLLNTEPDSPFVNRISRGTVEKHQLFALHSVAKEIKRLFSVGPVSEQDVATKTDYAGQFFRSVADELDDTWYPDLEKLDDPTTGGRKAFTSKLLELTGLIAWSYVGAQILSRSYDEVSGMNWANVERLVHAAAQVDWDKTGQYQGRTGLVGGKVMADDMIRLLPAEQGT